MFSSSCVRSFSSSSALGSAGIKNLTIIGCGLMGSGIAQVSAQKQMNVILVDQNQAILDKAHKGIQISLARVAKKKHESDANAQKNLAVSKADLVIEAIVENLDAKQKLFAQVEDAAQSNAIITTNTSSLQLADIGRNLKRKQNFGGLHFFNPVPMMKLLEVVRHNDTSNETFNKLIEYGKNIGKETVSCKDTPGFIVNRLLVPYMFEAVRMSWLPYGPFELADYVGLDTTKSIQEGWHKAFPKVPEPLFKPSKILTKLVEEGKFGKKSGEGFYKYK
uniref:3-hydroxyacyl-CoA dehydrogenase n=1 Tax=Ditylenchus dipsaci TaxID=166011 RepID=A0A915DRN4_9BILA